MCTCGGREVTGKQGKKASVAETRNIHADQDSDNEDQLSDQRLLPHHGFGFLE